MDSTNKKLDYIYDGLTQKPYSAWIKAGLDKWSDVVDELPEEEREKEVDKLVSNNNIELARAAKFKKAEMTQETTNMDKVSPMSVSSFASKFKIKE